MPALFSSPQQTLMLQNEVELEDFGLKERLRQLNMDSDDQKRRLLGSKVLSLFRKISIGAQLTLKVQLITRLFSVVEKLAQEMDPFAETAYRLLIFFFIEYHDNKVLR